MARNSLRTRRICFKAHKWQTPDGQWRLTCAGCGFHMDPVRDTWQADHWVRHAEGGTDEQTQPLCIPCHKAKTPTDIREVAKGKRNAEKHFGIRRSARPMAGSRRSAWKKHMDGTVSRRDGT